MRNNWFEIWYSYSFLITFATIETNKKNVYKIFEGYLFFFLLKAIFAFLSKHEICLFISITRLCNFKFINTYGMIKSLHHPYCLSIFFSIKYNTK